VHPVVLDAQSLGLDYQFGFSFAGRRTTTAFDDVTFALRRGSVLGVLGGNGSGKSSLLKVLAGIIDPSRGTLFCRAGSHRALLTLGLGFRSDLSGRDNAILSAMLQGLDRRDAIERSSAIQAFSELSHFFDLPVRTYSAGMRARLGFATALSTAVDVLLIDETLSVGDAHFREKAEHALLEKMSGAQTVVFVSHDGRQIERLCNQAIWLDQGRMQAEGGTAEVVEAYRKHVKAMGLRDARN
jgi:lipopolysaccharide transport system ATP-binding protein